MSKGRLEILAAHVEEPVVRFVLDAESPPERFRSSVAIGLDLLHQLGRLLMILATGSTTEELHSTQRQRLRSPPIPLARASGAGVFQVPGLLRPSDLGYLEELAGVAEAITGPDLSEQTLGSRSRHARVSCFA